MHRPLIAAAVLAGLMLVPTLPALAQATTAKGMKAPRPGGLPATAESATALDRWQAALEARAGTPAPRGAGAAAAAAGDPGALCRAAIQAAEREHRTAPGLLLAVARVESGRADPRTGALTPWPWTINAEGQGRHFDTREQAVEAVRALRARGITVIDAGCMQVNLHHHPQAFASLEDAFDPVANARYAAQFLRRLHGMKGDWEVAAAHYHSATPERGEAYRLKVLAQWPAMAGRLSEERQRQALAEAWGATRPGAAPATLTTIRVQGVQARALALSVMPNLTGRQRVDLPEPPPLRMVGRQPVTGRPVFTTELAEAPPVTRR